MLITLLGVQVDEIYIYSAKAAPKYIYKSAPPHAASRRRLTGGGRWRKADEPMSDNSMLNAQASRINTQPPKAEIAEGCGCSCVCESLINSQPAEDSLSR